MVSTRSMASEKMTLLMSLQREMVEMKRRNEEITRKNEDEILALQKENEEMKRKFVEARPSLRHWCPSSRHSLSLADRIIYLHRPGQHPPGEGGITEEVCRQVW